MLILGVAFLLAAAQSCQTQTPVGQNMPPINGLFGQFPYDITLKRNGPIAFTYTECPMEATVATGSGLATVDAGVNSIEPFISAFLEAPKNTTSTATLGSCGLLGRMRMAPADDGSRTARGTMVCNARMISSQTDFPAKGYTIQIMFTLYRVDDTDSATLEVVGNEPMTQYCYLETFCTQFLPVDSAGMGIDTLTYEIRDVEFEADREYVIDLTVIGSLISSNGTPDLGGTIDMYIPIDSIDLTFEP